MTLFEEMTTLNSVDENLTDRQAQMLFDLPFDPKTLSFRALRTAQNGASCLPAVYVDARDVMDRLNYVVGVGNWETEYKTIFEKDVVECRLTVQYPSGKRVTRCDVGDLSDQKEPGNKAKAAYSDALKRAAVQFGIGSYFYGLKMDWVDYNDAKKIIPEESVKKLLRSLPEWAKPSPVYDLRMKCCAFLAERGLLNLLGGYKLILLKKEPYEEIRKGALALYGQTSDPVKNS